MDTIQSKLGFSIPQKIDGSKPSVELSPKAMKEWVGDLPISDTGACTKIVFSFLKELNGYNTDFKSRFNAVEEVHSTINTCGVALKKHYFSHNGGLTNKQVSVAKLAIALFNEVCLTYKDIIDSTGNKLSSNGAIVATAMFRFFHFSRLILQTQYLLYEAAPESLWKEIYTVYNVARNNKLTDLDIINKSASDKLGNVEKSFIKTVLLASTNPYQLRQIEQETVNKASYGWANNVTIKPFSDSNIKDPANYVFNLDSDQPPSPSSLEKFSPGDNIFYINTSVISNILGKVLNELETGELRARRKNALDPNYSLSVSTIKKLHSNWAIALIRANSRFEIGGKMTIAIGTPAAHYYISGKKDFASTSSDSGDSFSSSSDGGLSIDSSDLPTFDIDDGGDSLSDDSTEEESAIDTFANFQCETINISPTGSCLKWLSESHPAIEPGEIVCMRNTDLEDDQWSIGVIRWLKHDSEGILNIGIQLLGPYAKPAGIQLIKDDEPVSCFLRSLILPEVESLGMKRTIITPVLPFKTGSIINIQMNESSEAIKSSLLDEVDQTSYYKQFQYKSDKSQELIDKALEEQSVAKGASIKDNEVNSKDEADDHKQKPKGDDEFGSIWDDL
jgi:hypothetical protein